jgi:phosphatidylglycerophosphate synthase
MIAPVENRRPLKSRNTGWARMAAAGVARGGVSADTVSASAVVLAVIGAVAFVAGGMAGGIVRSVWLLVAAASIQLRLVCNLLDGMVAVEHGKGGPHGPIWNELPDRIADALFLVAAGYGAALAGAGWGEPLGWLAAVLAVLTAYVRELGRALDRPADFCGPGAKPQRMAVLTAASVATATEPFWGGRGQVLAASLGMIALLSAVTVLRRTRRLAARLQTPISESPPAQP